MARRPVEGPSAGEHFIEDGAEGELISGEIRRQQLQGDDAVHLPVVRAINLAHATGAEELPNFERADPRARLEAFQVLR